MPGFRVETSRCEALPVRAAADPNIQPSGRDTTGADDPGVVLPAGPLRRAGLLRSVRRIWPTHHANVHFYGTHTVDIDGELAKLDTDGYRPLRTPGARPELRHSRAGTVSHADRSAGRI